MRYPSQLPKVSSTTLVRTRPVGRTADPTGAPQPPPQTSAVAGQDSAPTPGRIKNALHTTSDEVVRVGVRGEKLAGKLLAGVVGLPQLVLRVVPEFILQQSHHVTMLNTSLFVLIFGERRQTVFLLDNRPQRPLGGHRLDKCLSGGHFAGDVFSLPLQLLEMVLHLLDALLVVGDVLEELLVPHPEIVQQGRIEPTFLPDQLTSGALSS
mmetsp:Transcript_85522/g.228764  ORF Transcript_85522/g.228764 Transcript_85522/m.228764 type:complete len:209 (-) Transcript_85522:85-711(-)